MELKISSGNSKMGNINSVSLPSIITCRKDCSCKELCYAAKLERIRKTVRDAYKSNLDLLTSDPDTYWREVEASIMMSHFFRFHVSGDIPDKEYFRRMVEVSARNPHCEILCFTKKYDIVNDCINDMSDIPDNLHVIFSAWRGLEMVNPFNLPEAHVRYKDGSTTAKESALNCGGNCTECALVNDGCWSLKHGEQVVFNEH